MAGVRIREATPDDVDAIRRIGERGWNAAYGEILSRETIDAAMAEWYDPESVRENVRREDRFYFVASADESSTGDRSESGAGEDVVGYVTGGPGDGDGVAVLGAIYVDPDRWNEGVGSELLEAFESACRDREYGTVRFQVLSDNEVAIPFYRSHGYTAVEERETDLFGESVSEYVFEGDVERDRE